MEGYKDVLAMHAAGFRHTVALCGTALCTGHIALLKRYTTSVRVMLDADKAGRKAADAIVPVLAGEGMEAVRIGLPEGDDPDSLFRRLGERRLPLTSVRRCGRPGLRKNRCCSDASGKASGFCPVWRKRRNGNACYGCWRIA